MSDSEKWLYNDERRMASAERVNGHPGSDTTKTYRDAVAPCVSSMGLLRAVTSEAYLELSRTRAVEHGGPEVDAGDRGDGDEEVRENDCD